MKNEFVWTDEMVRQFGEFVAKKNQPFKGNFYSDIEEFKTAKQKEQVSKDYEIIGIGCKEKYGDEILSVRRLSDGEVFSIGDVDENLNTINRFEILRNGLLFAYFRYGSKQIQHLKKVKPKQKLFTTEDGVDIFENTHYWQVETLGDKPYRIIDACTLLHYKPYIADNYNASIKKFSTKEKAETWILENRPITTSLKELRDFYNSNGLYTSSVTISFFKTKINNEK